MIAVPSYEGVVWIGGGTGSGKTTAARALAARHGLRVFAVDAFWYAHQALLKEPDLSPDDQWLGQTPEVQAESFELTSRRRLLLAMADLAALPKRPWIVVEGAQVLPDLLPIGATAVFLIPTNEFQRSVLAGRVLPPTVNPRVALENRIKKDQLYADRVASLATQRGFPVIAVDGSRSPEKILATIEGLFVNVLVGISGTVDLRTVRRWENDVDADNVHRWLGSTDAPSEPPTAYSFSWECGQRGCASRVDLSLEDYRAMLRVLAPAHDSRPRG